MNRNRNRNRNGSVVCHVLFCFEGVYNLVQMSSKKGKKLSSVTSAPNRSAEKYFSWRKKR